VVQVRDLWRAHVNMVMSQLFHKIREFLDSLIVLLVSHEGVCSMEIVGTRY
jgi:hypothetical protein